MQELQKTLAETVHHVYPDYDAPIEVTPAADIRFGDFASPIAFALARHGGESAQTIAAKLLPALQEGLKDSVAVTVSPGAPFINFTLSPEAWRHFYTLDTATMMGDATGVAKGRHVNLEFISANPTGPLTLANSRGGYNGDALANVFTYAGATVEREYYVNDSGNQILELGRSVIAARHKEEIEGGYKGQYIQQLAATITENDPYKAGRQAAAFMLDSWIKPMIKRMGITFDYFASEQALIDSGSVRRVRDFLEKEGLLYEQDGAVWLKTTQFGDDKNRVMQRSDEEATHTYLLKDIAYHWDKIERGYSDITTIVGADHLAEAKALELIITHILAPAAQWPGTFRQPIIQFVRLIENGQEVKMSKRAGTFITIDDLLDQINSDVARFFFLMRDFNSHMDFDLTLAKESSEKNPVYYVQYAYVRAKHILEQAEETDAAFQNAGLSQEERKLLIHLSQFSGLIANTIETYQIHALPHYAIDLAKLFHAFYAGHPVLKADAGVRENRLIITKLVFHTLQKTLALMGISQPERMVAEVKE